MKDKEEMVNLTSINITLSQSLTQAQEKMLMISKQLQALQVQTKTKTPATKITSLDKNQGCLIKVPLLDSWENPQTGPYQSNLSFTQERTPIRSNLWGQDGRKQEVV